MKAVRFIAPGKPPEIVDINKPAPGPGEILLRVGGAGVCHSDLHVLERGIKSGLTNFTLGHENAGWIEALGEGVKGWREGDPVAVYGPWGCGRCHRCQTSAENYCEEHSALPSHGGGLGSDGGMAEYMLVPSPRLLVPLGNLAPAQAAPLSDAALTPYAAIKAALPMLTPDASVVVLGIGGLGHMAVQILRVLTPATLIAGDIDEARLTHAAQLGADHTVNTRDADAAVDRIAGIVGRKGVTVVLDFVGAQATIDLSCRIVGRHSRITIVGLAGGTLRYNAKTLPYGCQVWNPYWGSRTELIEVIELARLGKISADVETYALDQAISVYERLDRGAIRGRAVLVP